MNKIRRTLVVALVVAAMSAVSFVPGTAGIIHPETTDNRFASSFSTLDQSSDSSFQLLQFFRSPMLSRILLRIGLVG